METNEQNQTADQIIHLYGASRDVRTKPERRLNRFADKQFRIGDVLVRPGRRVPVTVRFLAGHVGAVIEHIQRGALRLESSSDRFIDPEEFKALVAGTPLPALVRGPGDEDGPGDEIPAEEPAEESQGEPTMDEPSDTDLANEAEEPLMDEPEAAPDTSEPETSGESYDMAAALPEAWRTRNKKGLLALCAERGLEANDKLSNRELVNVLEAWESSRR